MQTDGHLRVAVRFWAAPWCRAERMLGSSQKQPSMGLYVPPGSYAVCRSQGGGTVNMISAGSSRQTSRAIPIPHLNVDKGSSGL
ncbi:hypothetical protein SMG44B_30542 [Stenotrophomonas maltophilia]